MRRHPPSPPASTFWLWIALRLLDVRHEVLKVPTPRTGNRSDAVQIQEWILEARQPVAAHAVGFAFVADNPAVHKQTFSLSISGADPPPFHTSPELEPILSGLSMQDIVGRRRGRSRARDWLRTARIALLILFRM